MNDTSLAGQKKLKKQVLTVMALSCLLLTFLNSFGLQFIYAYKISGNVAYTAAFQVAVENTIQFFSILAIFAGYAGLVWAVFRFQPVGAVPFVFVCGGSILLSFLSSLAVSFLTMTPALFTKNIWYLLTNVLINFIIYAVVLALIFFMASWVRYRALQKNSPDFSLGNRVFSLKRPLPRALFFTALLYIAVGLIQDIYLTVTDLATYGLPVNANELVYLVSPYVEIIVYFFVGYCVLVGFTALFEHMEENRPAHAKSE